VAVAVLVVVTGACASGGSGGAASSSASLSSPASSSTEPPGPAYDAGAVRNDAGIVTGAHDCVPPGGGGAVIAWSELRNPIFATDSMSKDQAVRFADGRWHMLFSSGSPDGPHNGFGHVVSTDWTTNDGRGHAKIGVARSTDLVHWNVPPD
jgi:hypothetical protein